MEKFKWCFIGTGTLARQVAGEILKSGRHSIASIYTRDLNKAIAFGKQFEGIPCASADKAMELADAVYVVTPHPAHYQYVKQAIEMGKPVLCEKPFTVKADETKELFSLAKEKGVYIVEGMWTWFASVANKVKEWLDGGDTGEIQEVVTNFRVNVLNYAPRLTDPNLAGGAILDSGVYPITYLYRLFGKPEGVRCEGKIENGVDLSDEIDLAYPERTLHISLSIAEDQRDQSLRIVGSKAVIFVNNLHFADRAEMTGKDGRMLREFTAPTTMVNEFDCVAEEIRKGKKASDMIPPQATIDVMEIMDACRRQIGLVYPFE